MASLVTVTVCAGPHETVLVEVAAYPYTITGEEKHRHIANQPTRQGGRCGMLTRLWVVVRRWLGMGVHRIRLTTNEVKARLNLMDAPALDLQWWKKTR